MPNHTYVIFAASPRTSATERQGDTLTFLAVSNDPEEALRLARESQCYSDEHRITSVIIVATGRNRLFNPTQFSGLNMIPTELIVFGVDFTEATSDERFFNADFRRCAAPTDAERRRRRSIDAAIDAN